MEEELFVRLLMLVGWCLLLPLAAFISYFAHELDNKIERWLTDRALKKK